MDANTVVEAVAKHMDALQTAATWLYAILFVGAISVYLETDPVKVAGFEIPKANAALIVLALATLANFQVTLLLKRIVVLLYSLDARHQALAVDGIMLSPWAFNPFPYVDGPWSDAGWISRMVSACLGFSQIAANVLMSRVANEKDKLLAWGATVTFFGSFMSVYVAKSDLDILYWHYAFHEDKSFSDAIWNDGCVLLLSVGAIMILISRVRRRRAIAA